MSKLKRVSMNIQLGDLVEKAIETVVPKKVINYVKGEDTDKPCGCGKRKEFLNNLTK